MPLREHLRELRRRLVISIAAIAVGAVVGWVYYTQIFDIISQPIQDVVVTVSVPGAAAPKVAGPYRIVQENIAFAPRVLIVPVGAEVEFPNQDKVRHHVYSFSAAKRFQLKLYGRE